MSKATIAGCYPPGNKFSRAAVENKPAGQSITQQRLLSNILDILNQFRLREVRGGNPRIPQLKILCDLYRAVLVSRFDASRAALHHCRKESRNASKNKKLGRRKK